MSNTSDNPGEAMRTAMAILRHKGYGADDVEADWVPHSNRQTIAVKGRLTDLESGDDRGSFHGTATTEGRMTLESGAFGRMVYAGDQPVDDDPFHDL